MNATTLTPGRTARSHQLPQHGTRAGELYRMHNFRVLDAGGEHIGFVDWIWLDDAGVQGEFIGLQLRWLRGTARSVPMGRARIDRETSTIHVDYRAEQIKRAPRFSIDRALTVEQRHSIHSHYNRVPLRSSHLSVTEGQAA